jgi:hypothetical protein
MADALTSFHEPRVQGRLGECFLSRSLLQVGRRGGCFLVPLRALVAEGSVLDVSRANSRHFPEEDRSILGLVSLRCPGRLGASAQDGWWGLWCLPGEYRWYVYDDCVGA